MSLRKKLMLLSVLPMLFLCACASDASPGEAVAVSSDTLFVEKVENLPDDFILGMDASCVPALESAGVRYSDHNGDEKDVYRILSENGINAIRVRIWNDPRDSAGNGYGGGNCDIENAVAIASRAAQYGLKLIVDFHYSDFWADPGKQMLPKAWQGMDIDEKSQALYLFTVDCLQSLADSGVEIAMVQLGNETNGAMCGEYAADTGGWENIAKLMSSGSRAVREVCPGALVALHFTNPEISGSYAHYGEMLEYYQVDYDVFASSYYPCWHGTLDALSRELSYISETYGKQVMVMETSYAFTDADSDFYGNTLNAADALDEYPISIQGQADFIRDVVDTVVNKTTGGIGVCYWEGTWISTGGSSYSENQSLWERCGTGWASSFAASYDPDDAGRWYGGCAVDNQAFFDENGRATEALKVFALLRAGNSPAGAEQ